MCNAHKASTRATYTSAQRKFVEFINSLGMVVLPATEYSILLFIAFLYLKGLKGSSIRVYLSGIRNLHIKFGYQNPLENSPRIKLAVRGALALSTPPNRMKPITYKILYKLIEYCSRFENSLMLQTAMALAFFGCLRAAEFCIPDGSCFDSDINLCVGDITFNYVAGYMVLYLKRSKTDMYNQGTKIYIGCSGTKACAYCLMHQYLSMKPKLSNTDPLFTDKYGVPLKKSYFVNTIKLLLSLCGIDPQKYSGHSFRAGASTTGGNRGFKKWEIKMLGRWKSEAYACYLRNPKIAVNFAKKLANF